MTLFMFWMTGTSMSVWTIMISMAFVLNPIKQIFMVNQGRPPVTETIAFIPFENKGINLLMPKLTFMFFNSVILLAALYKFSGKHPSVLTRLVMGIIPVAPYDWVGLINSKVPVEHSQVVVS